MIPTEGLEADRAARDQTRATQDPGKPPKKKTGPKPKRPKEALSIKKLGRPPKLGVNEGKKAKNEMLRKGIYIRPTEFCPGIEIEKVLEGVKEIANAELRSLPQQVLWILKEKVKEWKKEHKNG